MCVYTPYTVLTRILLYIILFSYTIGKVYVMTKKTGGASSGTKSSNEKVS